MGLYISFLLFTNVKTTESSWFAPKIASQGISLFLNHPNPEFGGSLYLWIMKSIKPYECLNQDSQVKDYFTTTRKISNHTVLRVTMNS